jgi:hypothetical protein|tara:strand:- start:451 stop:801 length:351 start_codon:yes stop_codon:yes gene_type:complete
VTALLVQVLPSQYFSLEGDWYETATIVRLRAPAFCWGFLFFFICYIYNWDECRKLNEKGKHMTKNTKKRLDNHEHDLLKLIDKVEQLEQMIINLSYKLKFQRGEKSEEGRTNQRQG